MKIHDISVRISPELVVYPGDPPVEIFQLSQISPAGDSNTSRLCLSTHAGTHIDPPFHMLADGTKVNEIPLETLIGECEVVDIGIEDEITLPVLQKHTITSERVIFKTKNSFLCERKEFSRNYTHLTTAAAEYLATRKLKLVGIDYLSIEKFEAKTPQVHIALLKAGTVILEGLNLSYVQAGKYELFCLPLKIKDGDGAPARVVLIQR